MTRMSSGATIVSSSNSLSGFHGVSRVRSNTGNVFKSSSVGKCICMWHRPWWQCRGMTGPSWNDWSIMHCWSPYLLGASLTMWPAALIWFAANSDLPSTAHVLSGMRKMIGCLSSPYTLVRFEPMLKGGLSMEPWHPIASTFWLSSSSAFLHPWPHKQHLHQNL